MHNHALPTTTAGSLDWDVERSRARRCKRWSQFDPEILDLTVAEMDLPVAAPVHDAVRDAVERQAFGYPLADEFSGVPEVASDWLATQHGLDVPASGVRLLPELMRGITAAVVHLTRPDSAVVVPTPTYGRFFDAISVAGRRAVEVPMHSAANERLLDLDRIDEALRAGAGSVLLCHPSNPVGRSFRPAELRDLAAIVDRYGARVISDEIHAPLRYADEFTPYAAVDERARAHAVTLFSATKAWNFPGLRCGLVAFTNPDDLTRWARLPRAAVGGMSPLGMAATVAAFRDGRPWLSAARAVLAENRALIDEALGRPGLAAYVPPDAGYLAWLDLRRLDSDDPSALLRERAGVATTPGHDHGAAGQGFVRLNFATTRPVLTEALDRVAAVIRSAG